MPSAAGSTSDAATTAPAAGLVPQLVDQGDGQLIHLFTIYTAAAAVSISASQTSTSPEQLQRLVAAVPALARPSLEDGALHQLVDIHVLGFMQHQQQGAASSGHAERERPAAAAQPASSTHVTAMELDAPPPEPTNKQQQQHLSPSEPLASASPALGPSSIMTDIPAPRPPPASTSHMPSRSAAPKAPPPPPAAAAANGQHAAEAEPSVPQPGPRGTSTTDMDIAHPPVIEPAQSSRPQRKRKAKEPVYQEPGDHWRPMVALLLQHAAPYFVLTSSYHKMFGLDHSYLDVAAGDTDA